MAHGAVIDVPLLAAVLALLVMLEGTIVRTITRLRLPRLIAALLCGVPLIAFEEHINCGAYGCTAVLLPPTTWFLLVELLVLLAILWAIKTTGVLLPTLLYSGFGVLFEFFLGAARDAMHQLAGARPLVLVLIMLWVGFSYAFISFLPIAILNADRR